MQIKKVRKTKKAIIITLAVLVLIVVSYLAYAFNAKLPPFAPAPPQKESSSYVNHKKSDTEIKKEGEAKKNPSTKQQSQSDTPTAPPVSSSTGKQEVNVLLSSVTIYDGNVEARGAATNTVEENATCTYVFTKGSQVIKKQTNPLVNPTSTTCAAAIFSGDTLASGTWNVTLEFSSAVSYGISTQQELIVP